MLGPAVDDDDLSRLAAGSARRSVVTTIATVGGTTTPTRSTPPDRLRATSGFDRREPTLEETRRARRAYYAAVSYIDDHVGCILDRLESLGLGENTVVIVTSDHGDMLGAKGPWFKMPPYEQSSRVPLIVHGPTSRSAAGRCSSPPDGKLPGRSDRTIAMSSSLRPHAARDGRAGQPVTATGPGARAGRVG